MNLTKTVSYAYYLINRNPMPIYLFLIAMGGIFSAFSWLRGLSADKGLYEGVTVVGDCCGWPGCRRSCCSEAGDWVVGAGGGYDDGEEFVDLVTLNKGSMIFQNP